MHRPFLVLALGGVLLAATLFELTRPDVLLVGDITIDQVDGGNRTGGAVSYAAAAIRAFGLKACVVTVAGPDADLSVFQGLDLVVVPALSTLTFEHTYTWFGNHRRLRVTANPSITLTRDHIPLRCRMARTVLLGPLTMYDVDAASFLTPPSSPHRRSAELYSHEGAVRVQGLDGSQGSFWRRWESAVVGPQPIGLMAQGFQRRLVWGGAVAPLDQPSAQLMRSLSPQVSLFLSDVETDSWGSGAVRAVADAVGRLVITQGAKGALEHNSSGLHLIPPEPVPFVADTNGAGDIFASSYMIALIQGAADPAAAASWAASRAVMMPQSCKPGCACEEVKDRVQRWGGLERLTTAFFTRYQQTYQVAAWLGTLVDQAWLTARAKGLAISRSLGKNH